MKNDRSITEVLAEELSISEQEASTLINQWSAKIQESLDNQGESKVEAFGTFKKSGGKVLFEPDEKFALEVNYKYAGMKPVEILPAYRKSGTEEQTGAQDIPAESDDVEEQSRKEPEKEQKKESPQEKLADKAEKSRTKESAEPENEQQTGEKEKEMQKSEKDDSSKKDVNPFKGSSAKEKETAGRLTNRPESKVRKAENSSAYGKKKNNTEWLIVGGLAVLLVAGILHFIFFYDPTPQIPVADDRTSEETEPAAVSDEDTDDPVEEEEMEVPVETEVPPDPPERWGYTGNYVPMDEYITIVVYSLRNRERAEEQYDEINDAGLRATLNTFQPEAGTVNWRVGIGQFESVNEAEEAAGELPEPWNSEHFIIRIR